MTPSEGKFVSDRFKIRRKIGAGAMGVVYEAEDSEREVIVALKTLPELEPNRLARFKQEFRLLAGITHPNLVMLYELFAQNDQWFFTMEYVDGVEFFDAVQMPGTIQVSTDDVATETAELGQYAARSISDRGRPCDPAKLRVVLAQAAEGIDAIHKSGRLHRDIKASNILVDRDGRAVILDFGLVTELSVAAELNPERGLSGTIAYMSPEQSAGAALGPPSDWYAFGVMMYRGLTGRFPFEGTPREVLYAKQTSPAPPPGSRKPGIPPDLEDLCSRLLATRPEDRPGIDAIRQVLGRNADTESVAIPEVFVGRDEHLQSLRCALDRVAEGRPVLAMVVGPSGVGKSTLTTRFLEENSAAGALILAGRCYEQETVPFRALDNVIDALAAHFSSLPDGELAAVRPTDAGALAKAFPVLGRIPGFRQAPIDEFDTRRLAFRAARETLQKLAHRRRLIVSIDDLQWGDADSAMLLADVLRPPDPPAFLLLVSMRDGAEQRSECVKRILDACAAHGVEVVRIPVAPLNSEESRLLAGKLRLEGADAEAVAREAGGNPFFIVELARNAVAGMSVEGVSALDQVLWNRICRLPGDARQLLETISVAGNQIRQADAYRAAGLRGMDPRVAVMLRNGNLVRAQGGTASDHIEAYHDRVRETVLTRLEPERKSAHHLRLARTLELSQPEDVESLAVHFEGGGELIRAGEYYSKAAENTVAVTAYDRAAMLFAKAGALLEGRPEAAGLRVRRADTLALAGRAKEAADLYAGAALEAPPAEATTLERNAGYHYASSGYIEEGRVVLQRVLARVGKSLPSSTLGSLLRFVYYRARLSWRGLDFQHRDPSLAPTGLVAKWDAVDAVNASLGMVDLMPTLAFSVESLLLALEIGDPVRIARCAGLDCSAMFLFDRPFDGLTMRLIRLCERVAAEGESPLARAYANFGRGSASYGWCYFGKALPPLEEAERIFREEGKGAGWVLDTVRTFQLFALSHLGHWTRLRSLAETYLETAEERGNLFMAFNLGAYMVPIALTVLESPDAGRKMAEAYHHRWTGKGFHLQHLMASNILVFADLAEGRAQAAWDRLNAVWPKYKAAQMQRLPNLRIYWADMRGRAALEMALRSSSPDKFRESARKDAQALLRERTPHAPPMGAAILAAIAYQEADLAGCRRWLEESVRRFDEAEFVSHAAAVRLLLARTSGGDRAGLLEREAEAFTAKEGIRDRTAFIRFHCSGFSSLT